MYFDRQGQPISQQEWTRALNDETRRVDLTGLPDGTRVSTVWLGIDHNFSDVGPPLIFETMVFGADGDDLDTERYATEEQARAGHEAMVAKWSSKQ